MSASVDMSPRAAELHARTRHEQYVFTDHLFVVVLMLQFVGAAVAALVITPRTWVGASSFMHIHVSAAIALGGLLTALPIALVALRPGHAVTRHVIAISQTVFSALLIHLTGGRIETHFHVFGSLAFIAFYRDWRVLASATAVVAADHLIRGLYWPESVFGVLAASKWRWLEHAGWVVFEDVFLFVSIRRSLLEMRTIATTTAELEAGKERVEEEVRQRTSELERALETAECANRAKTDFLTNMSHEIRTPMTAIMGFTDILQSAQEAGNGVQAGDAVQTIRRNGENLLRIIGDILDVSRIESGELKVNRCATSVVKVVDEVVERARPGLVDKPVALTIEYATRIPDVVETDAARLGHVLGHLVDNGIKFTDRGSVTLRVAYAADDHQHGTLRFDVSDTGIGMTPAQAAHIFDPFSQADTSTSRRYGGTGLGLHICSRVIALLGGTLRVESDPGAGSTFTATIDAGCAGGARLGRPEHSVTGCPAPTDTGPPLAGLRVLLAEDGPDNQRLIAFHMRKAGATVDVVANGALALEQVERAASATPYDLILMDMQMPEMDGYAATRTLRERGYDLPVIALTAHAMHGDRERCMAAGCTDYDTKPVQAARLVRLCRAHATALQPPVRTAS